MTKRYMVFCANDEVEVLRSSPEGGKRKCIRMDKIPKNPDERELHEILAQLFKAIDKNTGGAI